MSAMLAFTVPCDQEAEELDALCCVLENAERGGSAARGEDGE
jgi:hypothetical protein